MVVRICAREQCAVSSYPPLLLPQTKESIVDCKCPVYYYEFPLPVSGPAAAVACSVNLAADELRAAMELYVLACGPLR